MPRSESALLAVALAILVVGLLTVAVRQDEEGPVAGPTPTPTTPLATTPESSPTNGGQALPSPTPSPTPGLPLPSPDGTAAPQPDPGTAPPPALEDEMPNTGGGAVSALVGLAATAGVLALASSRWRPRR